MKRFSFFLLFLLFISTAFAQTQQGIVKTRGRVVNGKVVAGTRLSGATITLNIGNPLVSGQNGAFSFNVPSGKNFSLVMAKKQGYTLADPEYTRRSFKYSASNPFYVVLEDEAQRQADIKEATDKVRKTLKRELRKREDELDELRESNAITQAKYDSLRMEFANYRQSSEALVNEMAERFAAIDYDQLDEFNRQVQQYIEEGELLKADSLINTRGSLEERYARVKEQQTANTQREEEIRQQQESLAKSQELTRREKEDLMSDLYAKHTIYLQAYQQDSALYCLKMRADLDTMNIEAVWNYAYLCDKQKKFEDCEKYYLICLRAYLVSNDLPNIADTQNNLGALYSDLQDYAISETYYKLALENRERLFNQNPDAYRADLAMTQNNLGNLYSYLQNYAYSEKFYKLALANKKQLFNQNPDAYIADLAMTQNNLGALYSDLHDHANSEKYYKLALANYEQLFQQNPDAYRADLAALQNNLGILYKNLHDYATSEQYHKLALANREQLFQQNPDSYREDLAMTYWNVMLLYGNMGNMEEYDKYLGLALDSYLDLYQTQPTLYVEDIIELQNRKVWRLLRNGDVGEAMKLAETTYSMDESNEDSKYYLSLSYNSKAYEFANRSDYTNAHKFIDNALSLVPTNPAFYDTKGEILLMQGRNNEALEMWEKVLELKPDFLDSYPDDTNLSNGLKKLGLIK